MTIQLRSTDDLAKMREAGRLAAEVLELIGEYVVPGVSTEELDSICHDHIVNVQKAIPACLGYRGFPKSICTSVSVTVACRRSFAAVGEKSVVSRNVNGGGVAVNSRVKISLLAIIYPMVKLLRLQRAPL